MSEQKSGSEITNGYRYYALGVLLVVYIVNFIDRQVLSILIEPIKEEMQLTDGQLGLLGGIAFAIFYTTFGLPLARLADRVSRRNLLSACLVVWSLMTVAAGMAQNFIQLLLARIGVGVGEAGASPTSHSIIADLFPVSQRATALSIYALGIPIGTLVGFAGGGLLAELFGWRTALIVVGAPGVLLAVFMMLTVREPPRSYSGPAPEQASLSDTLRYLWRRKSFVHLAMAGGLCAFTGYGNATWIPSLLARLHDIPLDQRGYIMALLAGVFSALGTFAGGWLVDRLVAARNDSRWYLWIPALGQILAMVPIIAAFLVDDLWLFIVLAAPAYLVGSFWLGPSFAAAQNLAPSTMRAFVSSILLFVINIVGLGGGVWIIGVLSDWLTPAMGDESIRYALVLATLVITLWGILHLVLAAMHIRRDLEAKED